MDWQNTQQSAAKMIYEWRKEDKNGELTEPCTLDAIIYDEIEDGAELDNDAIFDALATENKRLERTAQLVGRSLNRTSSTLKIVENGIHISKPMRKNGVTNIAIIYELTDGQTVSVLFHNPDTTPNKLKPDDMMIAWRWLLNRKDITIVVAKEKGRDLPIQQIANRVMALADKNTARFAKANAKKGEETQLIKQLEEENAKLEERLEHLNKLAKEKENGSETVQEEPQESIQSFNASENKSENNQEVTQNQQLDEEDNAPIEVNGNEFGDFDLTTEQGKQELRTKVFDYLTNLADKEEIVFCSALNADVGFTKSAAKKYKKLSGDPVKLQMAAQIKQIIAKSKVFKPSEKDYTEKSEQIYHYLKTTVKVAGVSYGARVVIREDVNGNFHYDLQVKDSVQAIMDSVDMRNDKAFSAHKSDIPCRSISEQYSSGAFNTTATFDEAQEKYVLNLFIFDENGNEIKDEDDSGSLNDKFDKQCNERKKEFISILAVSQNDIEEEIKRINSVKEYFTDEVYARAIRNAKLGALKHKYFDVLYKDENRFKKGDIVWEVGPTSNHYEYRIKNHFNDEAIAASDKLSSAILYDVIKIFKRNDPNERVSGELSIAMPKAAVEAFEELKKQYEDEIELKQPENAQLQTENEIDEKQERENQENNLTPLVLPENATPKMLADSVSQWLKQNVQGKVINTSDGKKVFFNRRESIDHLTFDGRRSKLAAQAISYIVDVFSKGDFIEREEIYKQRKDGFVAFHKYQKWVDIENKRVLLEAKAGEKEDGTLEIADGNKLIAYHHKVVAMDSLKNKGHFLPSIKSMDLNGELAPSREYAMDSTHDEIDDNAVLTILQVIDENGNEIKDEELSGSLKDETQDAPIELTGKEFGDFDTSTEDGKKALRQAAFDYLMELAESGESVFCKAVNANVGFNRAGAKKFKMFSANPIKNKIAVSIKEIIKESVLVQLNIPSYNAEENKRNITYSIIKTNVNVDGVNYGVRTVLRKLENGHFQYDLQIKDSVNAILDSSNEKGLLTSRLTNTAAEQPTQGKNLDEKHHTATFDDTQEKYVLNLFIFDENGNEIKDEEEFIDENNEINEQEENKETTQQESHSGSLNEQGDTSQYYQFDENKTKTQRQKDNNAVFDLLDKADKGELTPENITPAQKARLAKYSGSGGGLKSRDGKTGSPHEYYTPAPIAQAMWQAVEEMGFNGGKVLDPCAGSGIFGAYAPKNTVIQAIEMDETSAQVNRLVNGGDNYHVETASFEEMAKNIPDNSVDAIVTNIPFGDVSLRKHRNKDGKFQKENLQTYFVLRSLDKLRYGGLACFIAPASFLDNKGGKAKNARVLTSQIAEFIGAYRLPNSVFGTASADVATDVIFYRKYKKETIEKIEELQAQNPDILAQAKVMWDKYIDGQYFRLPENKKFIFGEETEIESWRTDANGDKKKVYAVINNDSVTNIAKAIKKFKGSRIDWALLEETETEPLIYNAGDVIHQNGQAYVFDGLTFNAVEQSESETESFANDILSKLENPLMAFEENVSAKNALAMYAHLINTAQYGIIPSWIMPLLTNIELVGENKREQQFKRVLTSLSVQYVLDNFDNGDNTVEYPELSEEMKKNIVLDKKLNVFKKANDAIKLHWNKKTGFSNVWKGIKSEIKQELSNEKKIEQFQYLNGTLELPIEKLQSLNINPLESDDWCINADGTTAMKADDYFVCNVAECLAKIDADIQAAKTPEIKAKLEKMRKQAEQRIPEIDVSSMAFSMRSPFIDKSLLKRFLDEKLEKNGFHAVYAKNGIDISGKAKSDEDKIYSRIGHYLQNGTVTHGGIKIRFYDQEKNRCRDLTEAEVLKKVREKIVELDAEFNIWLKTDYEFLNKIRQKAKDPKNLYFEKTDDESALNINGANSDIQLHGYQNSFVRKMAREFSGINAFGVGLGKTFTGIATAQYALETGTKKKICFILPNSVMSNWSKEVRKYLKDNEKDRCLFVGGDIDRNGDFVVNSKNYARDLNAILENKHNKIFITQQAFEKIRLREESVEDYLSYLGRVDKSFAESQNASKNEKATAKKENLAAEIAGKNKLENAPYFEDLGIDAVIVDEAHHFKNAKTALKMTRIKGLPSSTKSARAIDINVKTWLIRNNNPRKDGVLLLTATPVTNSPIEIYSMLSLALGEERVNASMLGAINSPDEFLESICDIQNREEWDIQNDVLSVSSLVGIKNLELLKNLIHNNSDIKNAKDVGASFKQVESEDISDGVVLDSATRAYLDKTKDAYRIAKAKLNNKDIGNENPQAIRNYEELLSQVGSNEKLGHAFSMIKRMNNALLDMELIKGTVTYTVDDIQAAQKAVDAFNKLKKTFKTTEEPENKDAIIGVKETKDADTGEKTTTYTVAANAVLNGEKITLNCNDFAIMHKLEELLEKEKTGIKVSISPKVASLCENVKKECVKNKGAKQLIFVETLAMHTKVKRALVQQAGLDASRISFISGQFNSDIDEIIQCQEDYNENNKYDVLICNKKAEVGINLQKGTTAIHHLELNWTPDSITQRNGRGVRQGNTAEKVCIYYYEANGTFDTYRRTTIDKKSDWIDAIMDKKDGRDYANVGQAATQEDVDEMIDFDGDNFEELLKKQEQRKQAELDKSILQRQQVNVNVLKNAVEWLDKNNSLKAYIVLNFNEKMIKIKDALRDVDRKIDKAERDDKTNTAAYRKLLELETQLRQEVNKNRVLFEGIFNKDYNRALLDQNYIVFSSTKLNDDELPETHPIVVAFKKETNSNLQRKAVALENAKKDVNTDGAVSVAELNAIKNNNELLSISLGGELSKIEGQSIFKNGDGIGMIGAESTFSIYYSTTKNNFEKKYISHYSKDTTFIAPDDAEYQEELNDFVDLLITQQEKFDKVHYLKFFPNAEKMFKEKQANKT